MTKARSAKGVMVDFDLLKIKQNMASAPVSVDVKTRQDFIESKLKRNTKKTLAPTASIEVDVVPDDIPEPTPTTNEELITDLDSDEVGATDGVAEDVVEPVAVKTQKARRTKK